MSKNIEVNGKEMTTKEALDLLDDPDSIVNKVAVAFNNQNYKASGKLTNEGFDIPKVIIAGLCNAMDEVGARNAKLSMMGAQTVMGRNVYVIMVDADDEETNSIIEDL